MGMGEFGALHKPVAGYGEDPVLFCASFASRNQIELEDSHRYSLGMEEQRKFEGEGGRGKVLEVLEGGFVDVHAALHEVLADGRGVMRRFTNGTDGESFVPDP
ncbi:hypothetical protein FB45DRAFT_867914 [Roridomyces roridus]|uniref:Uncharacterized protein n=1 Tax=Roridomyces roridus TaxID=1738132 RepID=A0AAD7BSG7_9AGAR|nr:hypothetical protein FB45DRAFT_867914 [Roridomyces roridus]